MGDELAEKMIGPEEKPIIENIISLFQQLLSMQNSSDMAPIEAAMDEDQEEMDELAQKAVIDETGDTKAEDRLSNQTRVTDESLNDLKKAMGALTSVLTKKKTVKKSQSQPANDQLTKAVTQMTALMKSVVDRQNEQSELMGELFTGLGFSEEVIKKTLDQDDKAVTKNNKPVQNIDTPELISQVIAGVMKNMGYENNQSNKIVKGNFHRFNDKGENVNKDMTTLIDHFARRQTAARQAGGM